MGQGAGQQRWRAHPVASSCLRALVLLVPIAASVAVGITVGRLLDRPSGLSQVGWWIMVFGASALALVAVERLARAFLPLAGLLRLSLIFPDHAPSRVAVAMRAMSHRARPTAGTATTGSASVGRVDTDDGGDPASRTTKLLSLAAALNVHDRRTRGHSERVRVLSSLVAEEMGLDEAATDQLLWGALLHDIGKLAVPSAILNKPGIPDAREWAVLAQHPVEGMRIAGELDGWLDDGLAVIGEHHERYDGMGYPRGLSADEITLTARIVSVTDAFETMTAVRSYKTSMSVADARAELVRCAGTHFDPDVVRAFLQISIGRLHWAVGATALVAQLPLLGVIPRAGAQVAAGVGGATYGSAVAGVAAVIATAGLAVGGPSTPPAVATTNDQPAAVVTSDGDARPSSASEVTAAPEEAVMPPAVSAAQAGVAASAVPTTTTPTPTAPPPPPPSRTVTPPPPPPPPDDGGEGGGGGHGHGHGHGHGWGQGEGGGQGHDGHGGD